MQSRWAVFISGRGSNLAALLEMRDFVDISLVVSSRADAPGVLRAKRAGVPVLLLDKKIDWLKLDKDLRARKITNIFLAGFMRVVPADFVSKWHGRILNLHPSLLPAYPGLKSIERGYDGGADLGVSVHIVNEGVDEGPLVAQRRSLISPKAQGYSLEQAEFYLHVDEQRLIRETLLKWK